jgi:hypothetical protein
MSDTAAVASELVLAQLMAMRGQPVRITIKDPDSQERLVRIPGLVSGGEGGVLGVECLTPPVSCPVGTPVTAEILAQGQLFWCHTSLAAPGAGRQLLLQLPITVQTAQRRRYPRLDLNAPVHLVMKEDGRTLSGVFQDLSAGGAALRVNESLQVGQEVRLIFALGSGLFLQDLEAEIVRCALAPDASYVVALLFHCGPEQEQALSTWVSRQLSQSGRDE